MTRPGHRDLARLRPRRQMVFQDPTASLNPWQTVGATVDEALRVNGWSDRARRHARVRELFDLVRLESSHLGRHAHALSGGQRQRVCIARALATDPAFIVADEALASLDVSIQAQIADLLLDLRDELGTAYLFITHDLAMAGYVCDQVAVMRSGRIAEQGPAERVLTSPQSDQTRALLAAAPAIPGWVPGAMNPDTTGELRR